MPQHCKYYGAEQRDLNWALKFKEVICRFINTLDNIISILDFYLYIWLIYYLF
jgi:hypothetical protein